MVGAGAYTIPAKKEEKKAFLQIAPSSREWCCHPEMRVPEAQRRKLVGQADALQPGPLGEKIHTELWRFITPFTKWGICQPRTCLDDVLSATHEYNFALIQMAFCLAVITGVA
ncbi:hypothetical protein AK812_SmicGene27502 [Symbiodinium microadriaticum]|uniref:Uncharacterized protein n=1 Tax=Symbiodinium microadriaticum TaxID=2951 RepID=A0A1Q9D6R6_SYMMI|nr:hypothetical protein AK812_SmicGene27502 [Symbiodinium microadriaticum]